MMKIIVHTAKSQTLFSILSLNANTLKLFMLKLLIGFNAKLNCAFSPASYEILFGTDLNTSRNNELKLNYCLLFANYYLHYQKMFSKACNIIEFELKIATERAY